MTPTTDAPAPTRSVSTAASTGATLNPSAYSASSMPPGLARLLVVSTLTSTIVVFSVVAGALIAYQGDAAQALIVAAFVSFWGGPGFGVMSGIALHQLRTERSDAEN